MGSKSRIKKHILPILQHYIDTFNIELYVEPFVGGVNVIEDIKCKSRVGSDISLPLIALFKELAKGYIPPETVPKEFYDDVRANRNTDKYPQHVLGAVGFLASYNGRYFDGGYARPTVKDGVVKRDYYQESKRNIMKQVPKIKDITFFHCSYEQYKHTKDALVYCDIPYKDTKGYDTSKNFDYEHFDKWAEEIANDNIVILSEINPLSDNWVCIWEQEVLRSIKSKDKSRAVEKLFIHKNSLKFKGGTDNA